MCQYLQNSFVRVMEKHAVLQREEFSALKEVQLE